MRPPKAAGITLSWRSRAKKQPSNFKELENAKVNLAAQKRTFRPASALARRPKRPVHGVARDAKPPRRLADVAVGFPVGR